MLQKTESPILSTELVCSVVVPWGGTGSLVSPSTSCQDQFSNLPKFNEKILELG